MRISGTNSAGTSLKQIRRGERAGHAFRTLTQMQRWFTAAEQLRLAELGYHLVAIDADRILAESTAQVLFARRRPLRFILAVLPWPCAAPPILAAEGPPL